MQHALHSLTTDAVCPLYCSIFGCKFLVKCLVNTAVWQYTVSCFAGSQSPAVPTSLAAGPNRLRRLQDWVNRELQALLDQEDVSIVRSFVISLATAHRLDRHLVQPHSQQQAASNARDEEEALTALQPFLHERTAHFWHELK